jgi:transcriptional regulator with XRE-family HTH domain
MKRNFAELKARMAPDARVRAEARTKDMIAEMLLTEIRQLVGLTQEDVAKKLGIKQPTLSKLESQDDMYISTLRRLVEALGGKLEMVVHLPAGDIRIQQFEKSASA